jgi:uncharacterized protein (TIGR02147 family)
MGQEIKSLIKEDFKRKQDLNSRYSMRAYAKYLGMSVATLSKILSGKTKVTPAMLKKIAPKLNLSPQRYNEIADQLRKIKKTNVNKSLENEKIRELQTEEFDLISNWYHLAILQIFNLDSFSQDPKWIANKLGIEKESKVQEAINRLLKLKLLSYDDEGNLYPIEQFTSILSPTFSSVAMRERQKQVMKLGTIKIDQIDINKRDNSSIVVAVDEELLPEIKERIKKFRRSLGNYIVKKGVKKKAIYELQVNFIPLTEE